MCFGGTKNGMAVGEAIIFLILVWQRILVIAVSKRVNWLPRCVLSAPWVGLLESGAWLRNAQHANCCAQQLAARVNCISGISLMFPVQANAVFVSAPLVVLDGLRERGWRFYTFIGGGARFMFAWDSDPEQVDKLGQDIQELSALIG